MAIYWIQLIISPNLRTNTNERGGIWTQASVMPVPYLTNEPTRVFFIVTTGFLIYLMVLQNPIALIRWRKNMLKIRATFTNGTTADQTKTGFSLNNWFKTTSQQYINNCYRSHFELTKLGLINKKKIYILYGLMLEHITNETDNVLCQNVDPNFQIACNSSLKRSM